MKERCPEGWTGIFGCSEVVAGGEALVGRGASAVYRNGGLFGQRSSGDPGEGVGSGPGGVRGGRALSAADGLRIAPDGGL